MSTELEDRAENLFDELIELPATERSDALARACADLPGLRRRVESLLATAERVPAGFLKGEPVTIPAPDLVKGTRIGDLELIERIGEGGMGTVYAARQASPRRDVAIKVIRAGRATGSAMRRFQFEIEVLGTLQHQGIARIYQAGATEVTDVAGEPHDVPYFVMELVRGTPLLDYVRRRELDVNTRLELFLRVCDAVQHAHQRGVIHRDLKSENVLVTDEETPSSKSSTEARGLGQPKILDFGIARTLETAPKGSTLETRAGDVLGSLSCMSPEQAEGDPSRVDVRSDVYALGVLLYRLLAGRAPLILDGLSLPEALRHILEADPPRLGTLDPAFRGDLSVIAAKALEKDLARRYRSAFDLAQDVRRHLEGRPIEARADAALYILRKEFQRHKGIAISVLLLFVLLAAFGLHSSRQARENRALAESESAARRAAEEAVAQGHIERGRLLGQVNNPHGEEVLWSALFRDPSSNEALWALREYYLAHVCLASRPPDGATVSGVGFLARRNALIVVHESGRVELLSTPDLAPLSSFTLDAPISCHAVDAEERVLAAGAEDGRIVLFDLETARSTMSLEGHDDAVRGLAFRGASLLSVSLDGTLREWDWATGLPAPAAHAAGVGSLNGIAVSPDGSVAAAGERGIAVWEGALDVEPRVLRGRSGGVNAVAFSHGGTTLWSGGAGRMLLRWDLASGEYADHRLYDGVLQQVVTADGTNRVMAVGHWNIEAFDVESLTVVHTYPTTPGRTRCAISQDGHRMVAVDPHGALRLWSLEATPPCTVWSEPASPTTIALSPDGRTFVAGDGDGLVRHVDIESMEERARWETGGGRTRVGFASSGRFFGWTERQPTRFVAVDAETDEIVHIVDEVWRNKPHSFAFHPVEPMVAVRAATGVVECWKLGEEAPFRRFETAEGTPRGLVFAPDGSELYVLDGKAAVIHAFTLADGRERIRFESPELDLWTLAIDPTGEILAAAAYENVIKLWNVATGDPLPPLDGHRGSVWQVHFLLGADGILAAISGGNSKVRLWDARRGKDLAEIDFSERTRPNSLHTFPGGQILALGGSSTESYLLDFGLLERRIARNLEFALSRFGDDQVPADAVSELRRWAREALR